jgi:hypothetical protein
MMYKRVTILLTFLAYTVAMVHNLVPHRHEQEHSKVNDHHHHHNAPHRHGESQGDSHQRGDEPDNAIHSFADAIHHPASGQGIHVNPSKEFQKKTRAVDVFIPVLNGIFLPDLKPPDIYFAAQRTHYPADHPAFFLLRAPPVTTLS